MSLVIIIGAIYFFSRPPKIKVEPVEIIDPTKLDAVTDNTSGLNNYGSLPKQVDNSEIGRTNPFDNY